MRIARFNRARGSGHGLRLGIGATVAAVAISLGTLVAWGTPSSAASGHTGAESSDLSPATQLLGGTRQFPTDGYGGVSVASDGTMWAVGTSFCDSLCSQAYHQVLLSHWSAGRWRTSHPVMPGGAMGSGLTGVSVRSATDAWAVGEFNSTAVTSGYQDLTEHWDGTSWTPVRSAEVRANLYGVADLAVDDAWAVGRSFASRGPVIEHWDGSSWSVSLQPSVAGALDGVYASSPTDVWAVGWYASGSSLLPLAEHFDGAVWTQVSVPAPTGALLGLALSGVSGASADDVWAAGSYIDSLGATHVLLEHWDGAAWSLVSGLAGNCGAGAVTAVTGTDVWAVGQCENMKKQVDYPVSMHWNGSVWKRVSMPRPKKVPVPGVSVLGVTSAGSDDVWAVGQVVDLDGDTSNTIIEHWDGSSWSLVKHPQPRP